MKRKKKREKIQEKSNNNKEHLSFYLLYKKSYFAWKHSLKKVVYTITFYLQFLCVTGYLKSGNDTPKLNIHKYNYNIKKNVHKQIKYYNVDLHSDELLNIYDREVRSF